MQWLAAFRRALNNVHSAVSQHNSDTIEQPVLDFYFWTSRKTRTRRCRRVAPATPGRFTKPQTYPTDASRLAALRRLDRLAVDDAAAIAASGARRRRSRRLGLGPRGFLGEEDERLARRRPDQP